MALARDAGAAHAAVPDAAARDSGAARRLTLSAAEFALLAEAGGVRLSSGFGPDADPGDDQRREAAVSLAGRGVLTEAGEDWAPVPAVAANLGVLAGPHVTLQAEVSVGERGTRALYALRGELAVSVFALADGAAELSMFPATSLGRELVRAVPPDEQLRAGYQRIDRILGGDGGSFRPLSGRLPLAALARHPVARPGAGEVEPDGAAPVLDAAARELADRVHRDTVGAMRWLVSGATADGVAVGQVIWLATITGWVGLRPEPGAGGARDVVLRPARRTEIGAWLAPYVARILEGAGR